MYTKNKEKAIEMNDNNKKNQDNGLRIPERKTQNSLLEGQNRAAIDFRRQKVEQIYKKVNTELQAEIQNQQENQTPEIGRAHV